jgi:spermidine synthase
MIRAVPSPIVPRFLARSLVFATSASVLVIEVLAVRLVAPYLGVSLEVFTGIIGVILAGISAGAWAGGRAADRTEPRRLLAPLLVAGGATAVASPIVVDAAGPLVSTGPLSIVVLTIAAFFLPATLLSAVSPVVVKIQLSSLERTGAVVGSYSAVGTAGAIFGTFLTGFVLIAAFPTRPIMVAVGILLAAAGLLLGATRGRSALWAAAVVGLSAATVLGTGPCDYETTYHCAIVETDPDVPTGRILVLDTLRNSYVDLADPTHLEFRYIRLMADIIESQAPAGPLHVVSVGGGGFTMPTYLETVRPGTTNVILEIDAPLVDIAVDELGFESPEDVVAGDARISLRGLADGAADVVVGDAFSGLSVPWHLTTVEFTRDVARVLQPHGLYVMNVIDYGHRRFARAAAATLRDVFDHVAVFAPVSYLDGADGGNFVLVGSQRPIDLAGISETIGSRSGIEVGAAGEALTRFIGDAAPLTDDRAPVDQMLERA